MTTNGDHHSVPSHMRTVPGSYNIEVAQFPSVPLPAGAIDPVIIASGLVKGLNLALANNDFDALSHYFVQSGYWRDHLALTWTFRTVRSPPLIREFLQGSSRSRDGFRLKEIAVDHSSDARAPKVAPLDAAGEVSGIQLFITLKTVLGTGSGLVKLVHEGGMWKIFTLYTRLEELQGYEEPVNGRRSRGVQHGGKPGRKNWAERRQADANFTSTNPAVLIIGKFKLDDSKRRLTSQRRWTSRPYCCRSLKDAEYRGPRC